MKIWYIDSLDFEVHMSYCTQTTKWQYPTKEQAIEELLLLATDILLGNSTSREWERRNRNASAYNSNDARDRAVEVLERYGHGN